MRIQNVCAAVCSVVLTGVLFAGSASAASIGIGDTVTFTDGIGTIGGEYLLTDAGFSFLTFSVQESETIDFTSAFTGLIST